MDTDAATEMILEEVQRGDIESFALIVRRYEQEIWRVVAYGIQDKAACEDLVQQTFVNAYQNLSRFETGRDFGAWLRTIARNLMRNELRRKIREKGRFKRYHQWLLQRMENRQETERQEKELLDNLKKCQKELSQSAAKAIEMRYQKGMGFADMASALNRSVEATRQMLSRIRSVLRRCLQERGSQA
jgi:RNA polymerase sigma-70 factor (ECF subfamily)